MNILQRYACSMILAMLQASVKNPKSLAKEALVLTQIRDQINVILSGING